MFKQSLTCRLLFCFVSLFNYCKASATYNFILRMACAVKRCFVSSTVHRYFTTESKLEKGYSASALYAFFARVTDMCFTFFAKLGAKCRGGVLYTLLTKLQKKFSLRFEHICAGFIVLMLLIPHSLWNNLYAFGFAVLLTIAYVIHCKRSGGFADNVRALPVSLLTFIAAILLGVVISPVRGDSLRIALLYLAAILFMLLCAGCIRSREKLSSFIKVLLGGLSVLCLFAVVQRFLGVEVNPEFTDVENNAGMPGRVFATMDNPNNLAEIIVLLLPFTYAKIFNTPTNKAKLGWVGVFALGIVALMMTYSRSSYVAFAIATLVFVALYNWKLLIPLGILVLLAIPVLPESVTNRILTIGSLKDTSNATRIFVWDGILKMLADHGLTGIGLGPEAFGKIYPLYAHIYGGDVRHAHMLYLELFVEMGVLGGIGFLTFAYSSLKKGLGAYNRTDKELRCTIIAAIASICGISFVCAAEYVWFYPRVMFIFFVVFGLLLSAVRLAKKQNGGKRV